MKCKACRNRLFDFRDGALSEREAAAVRAHLEACPSCREYFASEESLGAAMTPAFDRALSAGRLVRRSPAPARWPSLLLPAAAAALGAVLILVPSRPSLTIRPTRPGTVVLDDFPDPLRDWTEGRVILTVEDAARGTREKFLATNDGEIRRVLDKGESR